MASATTASTSKTTSKITVDFRIKILERRKPPGFTTLFNSLYQMVVDEKATRAMRESVLYKLSYHRFSQVKTESRQPAGYDRTRRQLVPTNFIKLDYFEEAYTTRNWLVRIYKLKKPNNRGWL